MHASNYGSYIQQITIEAALVRQASQSNYRIDSDTDWEIERLAYDFYGIPADNRNRITNELHELQRLQVVRELFPEKA